MSTNISINDINPLEHITSDVAISNYNYESIMNGLVEWNNSKLDSITIRLATNTEPYFVDYTIPTKRSYDTSTGLSMGDTFLDTNKYAYKSRYDMEVSYNSTNPDKVTLRFTVSDSGNTTWELYHIATVYDETVSRTTTVDGKDISDIGVIYVQNDTFKHSYVKNLFFRRSVSNSDGHVDVVLYKTIADIEAGDTITEGTNCVRYVLTSTTGSIAGMISRISSYGCVVHYADNVYKQSTDTELNADKKCCYSSSGMISMCPSYSSTAEYAYGSYVEYNGDMFMYVSETTNSGIPPYSEEAADTEYIRSYNSDTWVQIVVESTNNTFNGSSVVRYTSKTDISGFILKNIGAESSEKTSINVSGNLAIQGGETKEHVGLEIIDTCNYANWPLDTPKWSSGTVYSTDESKTIYQLQDYSAKMVFNHADPTIKYKNIINYDGPDLDQGLCIFLPVSVLVENNGTSVIKTPADGAMFEFLFRIWPNPSLNGNTANDLIINKAQIYVYNLDDYTNFNWPETFDSNSVYPIAKFSMARMTNFYVFDENIAVPDKPVLYKARFIYSKDEGRWKTYDYYQMPDQIFLAPLGFVDPSTNEAYGVQTAGFPMYQDPFCDYSLTPLHAGESYLNRITDFSSET